MKFTNTDVRLSESDIREVEKKLGLVFPDSVRDHYLMWNGGSPEPYVYEDENVHSTVDECLPLRTEKGAFTAVEAYKRFVVEMELVAVHFFPFATDVGGDFFFVDCLTPNGRAYLYRSDSMEPGLVDLGVGISDFWKRLKPEE